MPSPERAQGCKKKCNEIFSSLVRIWHKEVIPQLSAIKVLYVHFSRAVKGCHCSLETAFAFSL